MLDVKLVEFHDSRLERIELLSTPEVRLHFSHLALYFETGRDRFDVWSYRVCVLLTGLTQLEVNGLIAGGRVSHAVLRTAPATEIALPTLDSIVSARELEMSFESGALARFFMNGSIIEHLEPLEKFEEWNGPLTSER